MRGKTASMDPNLAEALRVLVEHVDGNRGVYGSKEEQTAVLKDLIVRKDLKRTNKPNGVCKRYDLEHYRKTISAFLSKFGTNLKEGATKYGQLYLKGSRVLTQEGLDKIGYKGPEEDSEDEAGEEEDVDGGDDVEVFPKADPNTRGPSETSTIQDTEAVVSSPETSSKQTDTHPTTAGTHPMAHMPIAPQPQGLAASIAPALGQGATVGQKRKPSPPEDDDNVVLKKKPKIRLVHTNNTQQPRPLVNNPAADSRTPSSNMNTSRLLKLSTNELRKDFDTIWNQASSFARKLIRTEVDKDKPPVLELDPSKELEELYQLIFGNEWRKVTARLIQGGSELITAVNLVECLTAAAVYKGVFLKEVPWDTAKAVMRTLSKEEQYLDDVLRESAPAPGLRLHTIVWQAARSKVLDAEFQRREIQPEAEKLACNFSHTINPQLVRLGISKLYGQPDFDCFWQQRHKDLERMFTKAVILRGLIAASPDYYTRKWVTHGAEFDPDSMEDVYPSEGAQKVAWCVSPLITVRSTQDGPSDMACLAKVVSMPII